jgi:hypothetical protein
MGHPPPQKASRRRKRDWLSHVERALSASSTLALVLAQLREKQGPLGWIAVGISATQFVLSFRKQYHELAAPDIWSFFVNDDVWTIAPPLLGPLLTKSCDDMQEVAKDGEYEIILGRIGEEEIAWRNEGSRLNYGPFFRRGREIETLRALGVKLWSQINGSHAVLGDKGAIESTTETLDHDVVKFEALVKFHERVRKFYDAGMNRSYLLEGPPGTGKSTAVRFVLGEMGVRSLRLNFEAASANTGWFDGETVSRNVEALVQTLRPEMLIVDDFDRNWMSERELLRLMEAAHKCCRVVIATINSKEGLSQAMQRVGRFDDHILVDRLELDVLKSMLDPELRKYARRMVKWPIAFVGDFNSRKRVLGVMAAAEEFQDLHARATGNQKAPGSSAKKKSTKKRASKRSSAKKDSTTKKVAKQKAPANPETI